MENFYIIIIVVIVLILGYVLYKFFYEKEGYVSYEPLTAEQILYCKTLAKDTVYGKTDDVELDPNKDREYSRIYNKCTSEATNKNRIKRGGRGLISEGGEGGCC